MVKSLPFAGQQIPVPGFGAMGLSSAMGSNLSFEQAEPVLLKALELGCTFWDTAVAYGAGINKTLLGEFVRKHNAATSFSSPRSVVSRYLGPTGA
jgi:aryl-alcohol dehydrogenase-like predicted oxidoreductase